MIKCKQKKFEFKKSIHFVILCLLYSEPRRSRTVRIQINGTAQQRGKCKLLLFREFFVENILFLLNEMLFRAAPYTGTSDLI